MRNVRDTYLCQLQRCIFSAASSLVFLSQAYAENVVRGRVTEHPLILGFVCESLPSGSGEANRLREVYDSVSRKELAHPDRLIIDFDGDGKSDELRVIESEKERARVFAWTGKTSSGKEVTLKLKTPFRHGLRQLAPGDFNGDGYEDLLIGWELLETSPSRAWVDHGKTKFEDTDWRILVSRGDSAVVYQLEGLPERIQEVPTPMVSADLDGDGYRDLIYKADDRLVSCRAKPGAPLSGARVQIDDTGEAVTTDKDGLFELKPLSVPVSISVSKDGYRFSRPTRVSATFGEANDAALSSPSVSLANFSGIGSTGSVYPLGPERKGPFLCLAYDPGGRSGPDSDPWGNAEACMQGYGAMGLFGLVHRTTSPKQFQMSMTCCKLPEEDMLVTEDTVQVEAECPDGYIVTQAKNDWRDEKEASIVCTRVNAKRYKLGSPMRGAQWGYSFPSSLEAGALPIDSLPLALRIGLTRFSRNIWSKTGCVARRPGALMTAKGAESCSRFTFRELQYRGLPGDPAEGTPVVMFPPCGVVENEYVANSGCLKQRSLSDISLGE